MPRIVRPKKALCTTYLEPVDRASADEAGEFQSPVPELLAHGGEAKDHVEVALDLKM